MHALRPLSRREFITVSAAATAAFSLSRGFSAETQPDLSILPKGPTPAPVPLPHFPSPAHAVVWRNWELVPSDRIAAALNCAPGEVRRLAQSMGLGRSSVSREIQDRSRLTVIKKNWHLLPYPQLLALLGWTPAQLAYTLREDDFLYVKLGMLKPKCEPVVVGNIDSEKPREARPSGSAREFRSLAVKYPGPGQREPLFEFVRELSHPRPHRTRSGEFLFSPRYCYSYFALYGDPLLEPSLDPYPDGYLARLAESGVNGVWLQGVLYKLTPFPWDPKLSENHERRLENLNRLIARAKKQGIKIYLYLNEPRAMPLSFFQGREELKGVVEGDYAALCTSVPAVREYLRNGVEALAKAAPELGGFFTITASENLTNCWAHWNGGGCPRCGKRPPGDVVSEVSRVMADGLARSGTPLEMIAWDWGWNDAWAESCLRQMPSNVSLQSVSEWSIPFERGGVKNVVGEYSISIVGPGPRATKHWKLAREKGLKTLAKIQAGNTWELSAVPYIPAVENVAQHAGRLRDAGVQGLMLGWTLGGYPSPNLEVVAEMTRKRADGSLPTPDEAMNAVGARRFGNAAGTEVVRAWKLFSSGFREFPYNSSMLYNAPMQLGPANLLWHEPTHYSATMVGFPYDDLKSWLGNYPASVFADQFRRVAAGFGQGIRILEGTSPARASREERENLASEIRVAQASRIHFESVANQVSFMEARNRLGTEDKSDRRIPTELESIIRDEFELARQLRDLQLADSRIGFEASNQYYYTPNDLLEKMAHCQWLLKYWVHSPSHASHAKA